MRRILDHNLVLDLSKSRVIDRPFEELSPAMLSLEDIRKTFRGNVLYNEHPFARRQTSIPRLVFNFWPIVSDWFHSHLQNLTNTMCYTKIYFHIRDCF